MSFKISNFNKPTPLFWKRLGNTAIYSLPLLTSAVMASPMSVDSRQWCNFVLTVVLVLAKALTKFFAYENSPINK